MENKFKLSNYCVSSMDNNTIFFYFNVEGEDALLFVEFWADEVKVAPVAQYCSPQGDLLEDEYEELTADEQDYLRKVCVYAMNADTLERSGVSVISKASEVQFGPFSAEIECYTPAGEDMIICLDELTSKCLSDYLDDFDINEHVVAWWPNGVKEPSKGVPFDNIKKHYEDYEAWIARMRKIADSLI